MAIHCCRRDPFKNYPCLHLEKPRGGILQAKPPILLECTNRVITAKYSNYLSWLLFSLLYQFKRAANIYFLFISILTFFDFSPKSAWSMMGTFSAVLIFSMLKELYEDHARKREDNEKNTKSKAFVFQQESKKFEQYSWEDIRVGDIIQLQEGKEVPADLLLLYSQDDDFHVYADTKNLDGEVRGKHNDQTNSKQYSAVFQVPTSVEDFPELAQNLVFNGIDYDLPNEKLDDWRCSVTLNNQESLYRLGNLLMRGSMLKKYRCLGLVMYVGSDTKIMRNAKEPPHKISNMIRLMNWMMLSVFCLQLGLVIGLSIMSWQFKEAHPIMIYFQGDKYGSSSFLIQMLVFWVAYSHMIPISLYVIVEVLKIVQKFMIQWDHQLIDQVALNECRRAEYPPGTLLNDVNYHDNEGVRAFKEKLRAKVRNSDLVEELGQISHIFSDKTGTLTKNELTYIKSFSNGREYLQTQRPTNQFFLLNIMLNHDIETENGMSYVGKSSDEIALLEAAREHWNMKFFRQQNMSLGNGQCRVKSIIFDSHTNNYEVVEFPIVHTLEFDSHRKRMSVLCHQEENDDYVMFVKGADSALNFSQKQQAIMSKVDEYAGQGLRTLVFGHRVISRQEYETDFIAAIKSLDGNEGHQLNGEEKTKIMDEIQNRLEFDGIVAIEDKLQEGVPATLKNLSEADIKIWILTGDKLETAREIGSSCGILNDSLLVEFSKENCIMASRVLQFNEQFAGLFSNQSSWQKEYILLRLGGIDRERPYSIIIDHLMLSLVLDNEDLKIRFFEVAIHAKTVLCCRSSPKQKSRVVKTSKKFLRKNITLAIGDGANDVPMIKEAHVGVAIRGKEGLEAHSASDYSITQFRFLERLLLVHGRLAYRRVAWMICYYFYKNLVLVATQLYFASAAGYSGQIFFADWLPQLYNSLWTSWPCLFSFIFQKDDAVLFDRELTHQRFRQQTLKSSKKLYRFGQRKRYFNFAIFWKWTLLAFIHGFVCYWVPVLTLTGPCQQGKGHQHWYISTVSFSCCIVIVTAKLFLETVYWNWFNLSIGGASLAFYFIILWFGCKGSLSYIFNPELVGVFGQMFGDFKALVSMFMAPMVALLLDGSLMLLQYNYCYQTVRRKIKGIDLLQELQKQARESLIEPDTERKLMAIEETSNTGRVRG